MKNVVINDAMSQSVLIGADAYISESYAKAEADQLWAKVWQVACRVEEIPNIGDYVTYDIMDDTIIVVRSEADKISAFFNVCAHRGRRLVDGSGNAPHFHCRYHAWRYALNGENIRVLDEEDWNGKLPCERISLESVKVDTWGGWVWINMDPDCEPLLDFLEPAAQMLSPFEFEKMRYRWRMTCNFDCNWKTALEAFLEAYHVEGTHPQLLKYADYYVWSQALGLHGNDGFMERDPALEMASSHTITRTGKGKDTRKSVADLQEEIWRTVNAGTSETLVKAAARLVDELPEGTPADKVMEHWMESARRDDLARGVIWPTISDEQMAKAGLAWHVFPNISILQGQTFAQVYRVRPLGTDPNKCVFESYVIELYPEGQEPKTEWVHADPDDTEKWPIVFRQDFANMVEVQKGMRSRGFRGAITNPRQERKVANFHSNLAKYMDAGEPTPLE